MENELSPSIRKILSISGKDLRDLLISENRTLYQYERGSESFCRALIEKIAIDSFYDNSDTWQVKAHLRWGYDTSGNDCLYWLYDAEGTDQENADDFCSLMERHFTLDADEFREKAKEDILLL